MANLSGTWLGTYWQDGAPTRFEMAIVQGGNVLSGNILDEGNLREATVAGEATGRSIQFTKKYIGIPQAGIIYQGVVSEDENRMQGEWNFKVYSPAYGEIIDSGQWEATRSDDDLSGELTKHLAQRKDLALVSGAV